MASIYEREQRGYAPIVAKDRTRNKPGVVVGTISAKHRIVWVVNPDRPDQRHGAIRYEQR